MKYENLTLITLNNTLHIKADNLEPVEVDSSCKEYLEKYVFKIHNTPLNFADRKQGWKDFDNKLKNGINISELSDRIEVMATCLVNDNYRAFLLPDKEDKCDGKCAPNECLCDTDYMKSYTIEEIKKAFEPINKILGDGVMIELINNLKK